jgi:glutamate formiminotransferase
MYDVYNFVQAEASKCGVEVLESELIGALRLDAVLSSAKQCLKMPTLNGERILDSWF